MYLHPNTFLTGEVERQPTLHHNGMCRCAFQLSTEIEDIGDVKSTTIQPLVGSFFVVLLAEYQM